MSIGELIIKGILVGFGVSAPIGPIGILCINRSINKGIIAGLATGLGAVVPNLFYTMLALAGVVAVISPYLESNHWLLVFSGLYICYLGLKAYQSKTDQSSVPEDIASGNFKAFTSVVILMITNPATLIGYTIIFTAIGLGNIEEVSTNTLLIVTGSIFLGAMLWWVFLSFISASLGKKIFKNKIELLNKISGSTIIGFGILIIIKTIF